LARRIAGQALGRESLFQPLRGLAESMLLLTLGPADTPPARERPDVA